MAGVVVFNLSAFRMEYPQFAAVSDDLLSLFFRRACVYLNNTAISPVSDLNEREYLLYLLVAHMTYLSGAATAEGQGSTAGQVGRVASAGQGSVSASLDNGSQPNTAAWYAQSQYGMTYWQATSPYRRFKYTPPCRSR